MPDVPNVLNQPPGDPRLLLSEPFRAVHFVFGLFHPDVRPLSGRALLGALGAIGFGDEASRGILLRLRRAGFLESRRSGREAAYVISPRSRALLDEMASRATGPAQPWDGVFHALVVHVPARERAYREQLRRHTAYAGFGSPSPGLLIAPYPSALARVEPLLARRPLGVLVTPGRLAVDLGDAAALAGRAWDLDARVAAIRAETARMASAADEATAGPPPSGAAALRLLWESIGPFFESLSEGPPLPSELLPDDWPMDAARAAFVRLATAIAWPANQYVDGLDAGRRAEG